MKNTYNFIISAEESGMRVDRYINSQIPDLSRAKIKLLIENGNLKINGAPCKTPRHSLKSDDNIDFFFEIIKTTLTKKINTDIKFDVIFEDEYLLILNKPSKLLVHPGAGRKDSTTLVDLIKAHCDTLSSISGDARPGIVHRLDMETSGLMVIAKDDITHSLLSTMFEEHTIKRKYLGLCYSYPVPQLGKISLKIKKSPQDKTRMIVSKNKDGKNSITHYRLIESYLNKKFSLIEFSLETGRTHQIRLHMEHKRMPIIGDKVYGRGLNFNLVGYEKLSQYLKSFPRHALHSYYIEFIHPRTKEELKFEVDLPEDMLMLKERLSDS